MKRAGGDDSTLRPGPDDATASATEPTIPLRATTPIPALYGYELGEVIGRGGMGEGTCSR